MAKIPPHEVQRRNYLDAQAALIGASALLDKISTTPGLTLVRGATYWEGQIAVAGDFVGPASSVLNRFVSFADTSGKLGKDSGYSAASFDAAGAATAALASAHIYSDAGDAALAAAQVNGKLQPLQFIFDGSGSVVAVGQEDFIYVPYGCTILGYVIFGDVAGSAVFDVDVDVYANFPPNGADSIVAAAPPTLTAALFVKSTTLTGWGTSIAAGSWVRAVVSSCSTITKLRLILLVQKT